MSAGSPAGLHPHDAHASTADAAHHALGHASHVAQAAHHWLPVVGWVFSATRAVRGYAADPVVSDARDEIELWTRIISRLRKIVAAQTAGAVVIVWLVLR